MRISMDGNAEGNYTLLSLQGVDPVRNKDAPDYYPLNLALDVSADFVLDEEAKNSTPKDQTYKLRFSRKIKWPNNMVPRDEPECGFYGQKCLDEPSEFMALD